MKSPIKLPTGGGSAPHCDENGVCTIPETPKVSVDHPAVILSRDLIRHSLEYLKAVGQLGVVEEDLRAALKDQS